MLNLYIINIKLVHFKFGKTEKTKKDSDNIILETNLN